MKDFEVMSRIAEVTFMVLAHPDVPAKNLPELLAYAKANLESSAVATDGPRQFSGMIAAWINKLAGTKMPTCLTRRCRRASRMCSPGAWQFLILAVPAAKGHVAAGKLKPLAVSSLKRLPEYPDVQAMAETIPGLRFRRLVRAGGADRRPAGDS